MVESIGSHESRYAKKRRGRPGPNSIYAIAELGDDGIWRVNGAPYRAPRPATYQGRDARGDVFIAKDTGERLPY